MGYAEWTLKRFPVLTQPDHIDIVPEDLLSDILMADAAHKERHRLLPENTREALYKAKLLGDERDSLYARVRKDVKPAILCGAAGGVCYLCGEALHWREAHMDHVIPRTHWRNAVGATVTRGNVMPTHQICGDAKADTMPTKEQLDKARQAYHKAGMKFYDERE